MAVVSVTNTDTAPKLKAAVCKNRPFQSRMINPPAAPYELLDPSKLTLTNSPWGFCQAIHRVYLWLWYEGGGRDGKSDCESLYLIRHSALARFARKRDITGFAISL